MHYYTRNIGDYHKKAGRLNMLQHGAYTLLLDAIFDREQFPTREQAIEWTWSFSDEEIRAVEFVLSRFFIEDDGVFIQKKAASMIKQYQSKCATNKRIAQEREAKRKQEKLVKQEVSTLRAQSVNETPPNQEPITNNHKLITNNKNVKRKANALMTADADIVVIFEYWKEVMKKNSATKLNQKRKRAIGGRLKEGYTVDDIKKAIYGCSITPFNMGDNSSGKLYNDIELICRDGSKLEGYRDAVEVKQPVKQKLEPLNDVFDSIMAHVRNKGCSEAYPTICKKTLYALRSIGGIAELGRSNDYEINKKKSEFKEAFMGYSEEKEATKPVYQVFTVASDIQSNITRDEPVINNDKQKFDPMIGMLGSLNKFKKSHTGS